MKDKNYTITYEGNLRVKMTHLKSATTIYSDAPLDNNGKGEAFSPTDLLASALTSCILTIMGIHFQKKGRELSPIDCSVKKTMQNDPRRVAKVEIEFDFKENKFDERDRAAIKRIADTCPVSLSLHPDLEVVTNL